ncbi:MAG: ABC transporter substrate-binding protein [Oscillospiraceae bacterium]|nr:ABC transporter substrate-binding protein [Oscillospiraceae bacterium]
MKTTKTLLSLLLALSLCLALCACAAAEEPAFDAELPVRVMTLNGTTGFGMAGLIAAAQADEAALNYSFSVETDASNITAALVSGDCDIAALPTNAAAALYNKTGGKVQVLALNTLGVLYLVTDGSIPVESIADLDGQTVYAPAQNPSYLFACICAANGLELDIDTSFALPAELNTAAAAGEVALAVLPEPLVTIARAQNKDLVVALDLTAEWDKVYEPGSLVQGCVVVRTDFAAEHPAELAKFLEEYSASIELLSSDPAAAAQKIEETGIFAKAAVAEKAIPRCNLCFITGEEMQQRLDAFLNILFKRFPQSIGGAVPGEDFYCILK